MKGGRQKQSSLLDELELVLDNPQAHRLDGAAWRKGKQQHDDYHADKRKEGEKPLELVGRLGDLGGETLTQRRFRGKEGQIVFIRVEEERVGEKRRSCERSRVKLLCLK